MTLKFGGNKMTTTEKYSELNERQKGEFARISNRLLSVCFLTKKKEENKKDYYFIDSHKEIFENLFKTIGWELEIDDTYGVMHLVNPYNYNRYQFKLFESILLLILRILFYEKLQELTLAENVVVRIDEIHQRFAALKLRDKPIDKGTLKSTLRLFKRFNIIDFIDNDLTAGDSRIIIYPTILLAIKVDDIRKVYDKLDTYKKGGEDSEEDNQDEID